ncbi:hypothetical protein MPTK1_4g20780 [Marchantia polymorpha subsp. ruderalis]|uniref:Uncharacterized protein n=2 Tax=Marchantia polymorpha TaxID=3197 RepID=A0AAF6BC35_MARPO|nr:hypothetical protein MARPO_0101s0024 [Marchantia polymorpha]BBN09569.1 hypothetical protein Mp_4g20780 [Marchantia polymorpha subsp. ruderalis]|eukprot:PTQ32226.1 hypothetical protein MARPO_0101s0024 [Marchantia polymorpha]
MTLRLIRPFGILPTLRYHYFLRVSMVDAPRIDVDLCRYTCHRRASESSTLVVHDGRTTTLGFYLMRSTSRSSYHIESERLRTHFSTFSQCGEHPISNPGRDGFLPRSSEEDIS